MYHIIEYIGLIGSIFSIISFMPQTYKVIKTKSVEDISIYFLISYILSCLCLGSYAIFYKLYPIILTNSCSLINCLIICYYFL
jgi:MtN3 and saliva related transmembrane protein